MEDLKVNSAIDLEEIKAIKNSIDDSVAQIQQMSNDIVASYTKTLDEIMRDIKNNVIDNEAVGDSVLEEYFLELTNALYFIGSKSEFLGLYEDFAKSNQKIKYNEAYSVNQLNASMSGKKATVDENRAFAEDKSINETVVGYIYSRSFRIIKSKVDSANEMVKTLSKIISKRMTERDYSNVFNPQDYNTIG